MGTLKVGNLDFNNSNFLKYFCRIIQSLLDDPNNYYLLSHTDQYYFSTNRSAPQEAGWYIILDGTIPLYVGRSDDINKRLNTKNGSLDNFNNPQRESDPERNFIKKYIELGLIKCPRVCVILEKDLIRHFTRCFNISSLSNLDKKNIEKHLNIWRNYFKYK